MAGTGTLNAQSTGKLIVEVEGIEVQEGQILIALVDNPDSFKEKEGKVYRTAKVNADSKVVRTEFRDLPAGTYAVKLIHDENGNGKMDTNFIGIPKEKFGFSNNAMGKFGPPPFENASFELNSHEKIIRIKLTGV